MSKLNILWTTTNKDTAEKMIAMYAINALKNNWWQQVEIIIWGGSAKLVGEDVEIQKLVQTMLNNGVMIKACRACSDGFGVTATLETLGITVEYMGDPLTRILKSDEKLLTV